MARKQTGPAGRIRVGVGGWLYAPWRGVFYPKGLKQADELAYAASHLTTIEINATHYRLQSPASFRKWAAAAPDGFVFSVKGPRLVTQQKLLADTGNFIKRFLASGLAELGDKLGPVLWQFAPFKKFDADDFARFLDHLPRDLDGLKLNHVIEARHASFATPEFVKLMRDTGTSVAFTDAESWPSIADITGDVVYARLQRGDDTLKRPTRPRRSTPGPSAPSSGRMAACRKTFRSSMPRARTQPSRATRSSTSSMKGSCDAPAAAMALIERLD